MSVRPASRLHCATKRGLRMSAPAGRRWPGDRGPPCGLWWAVVSVQTSGIFGIILRKSRVCWSRWEPFLLCSATDSLGLSGGEMVKESFRGIPVGEVIDEAVPRLSPPLLVDEALRCPSCMPPQCEPSCRCAVSSISRYN